MISVLMPTRNRPKELRRAVESIVETSVTPVEVVVYLDDDATHLIPGGIVPVIGPRIMMSDMWNKCCERASGDILMMGGDDMVFRTNGWDEMVEKAFAACADKIVMVHGDDGQVRNRGRFAVFPTIHRRWVETVGYFVPPVFTGDYADTWLNDVANAIGRRTYIPYVTEHLHPAWGKAPIDETYQEKFNRDKLSDSGTMYENLRVGRKRDADLLRAVMS